MLAHVLNGLGAAPSHIVHACIHHQADRLAQVCGHHSVEIVSVLVDAHLLPEKGAVVSPAFSKRRLAGGAAKFGQVRVLGLQGYLKMMARYQFMKYGLTCE